MPAVRALVQRVTEAGVTVRGADGQFGVETGRIGPGLCVLVGIGGAIWGLLAFALILVVSQFTLYGDTTGGRRPSWIAAARPEHAEPLVDAVVSRLRGLGATVATGRFRTEMRLSLVNDGPVTLLLER